MQKHESFLAGFSAPDSEFKDISLEQFEQDFDQLIQYRRRHEEVVIADLIKQWKERREAVILAHNYVPAEVQDVADYVGDSLQLAQKAKELKAKVIVLAGVTFMAETAKIVNPEATVLMPDKTAGCPMADMVTAEDIKQFRALYPDGYVVSYVNTTAAVKAESDVCVTSSNAFDIMTQLRDKEHILFVPDRNLGHCVMHTALRDDVMLWHGCCPVHDRIMPYQVEAAKDEHPAAEVLMHPECAPDTRQEADWLESTGGMLKFMEKESCNDEYIIATEEGLLHQLQKRFPQKKFYGLNPPVICNGMKQITPMRVLVCLQRMESAVELPADIMERARKPIERMLEMSK